MYHMYPHVDKFFFWYPRMSRDNQQVNTFDVDLLEPFMDKVEIIEFPAGMREHEVRTKLLEASDNYDYQFIIDTDEFHYDMQQFKTLIEKTRVKAYRKDLLTVWKYDYFCMDWDKPHITRAPTAVKCGKGIWFKYLRKIDIDPERHVQTPWLHYSYSMPDELIHQKIKRHQEIQDDRWFFDVYMQDPETIKDIHPAEPEVRSHVEKIPDDFIYRSKMIWR